MCRVVAGQTTSLRTLWENEYNSITAVSGFGDLRLMKKT